MDAPAFSNLLQKNRVDGSIWTHVSLYNPKGKYQFDRRAMETFWKHYLDAIAKKHPMSIAEKPQQYLPTDILLLG